MKIVFIHPDLGIGGAERLVVDVAVALKSLSHKVSFITSHHDPDHCFRETTDGTLNVSVVGDWIPRSVFGKCAALFAYLRMIYAAFYLVFFSDEEFDVVFCDQISACLPVFKFAKAKTIFYCHFPDQLLTQRTTWYKKLYRAPLDWIEEKTTGLADIVLVNSHFTESVFRETFRSLDQTPLRVLYPSLVFSAFDKPLKGDLSHLKLSNVGSVFLSINRYERKKALNLAVEAFAELYKKLQNDKFSCHLIMAGGHDPLVLENKEVYDELAELSKRLEIDNKVTFLKSPSDSEKHLLLHSCTAVIYTPDKEHFGIVPLEAMYMRRPVIAVNSGGPLETIRDGETGYLCEPSPQKFAEAMEKFVRDRSLAREMGLEAHEHVKKNFSYQTFKNQLSDILDDLQHNS